MTLNRSKETLLQNAVTLKKKENSLSSSIQFLLWPKTYALGDVFFNENNLEQNKSEMRNLYWAWTKLYDIVYPADS